MTKHMFPMNTEHVLGSVSLFLLIVVGKLVRDASGGVIAALSVSGPGVRLHGAARDPCHRRNGLARRPAARAAVLTPHPLPATRATVGVRT